MIGKLFSVFRKKPILVEGAARLEEGQSKCIQIGDSLSGDGVDVILARVDGEIFAVDKRCPHQGGFLADGPMTDGKYLTCPLHHYHFDPKNGSCINASSRKARRYKTKLVGEDLELYL